MLSCTSAGKMDKRFDIGELLQLHEKNHKSQPVQSNSIADGVKLSLDTQNNKRRTPKTDQKLKPEHRMEQLQLWKQEKERKKMEATLNKKKPFLVGVVHNPKILSFAPKKNTFNLTQNTPSTDAKKGTSKLSLGLNTDNNTKSKALKSGSGKNNKNNAQSKSSESSSIVDSSLPIVKKRVLRKRTETVLSKKNIITSESSGSLSSSSLEKTTRQTRKINRNFETTSEDQNYCIPESSSSDNADEQNMNTRTTIKSLAYSSSDDADGKQNTPRIITTKYFQEEHKHQTIKKENHAEKYDKYTPEPIQKLSSPCVTMARGKDNVRKEINKKNDEGLLHDGVYEVDHCEQQLDSEIKRTTEKLLQLVLPEAVKKIVLGAVGQARLMVQNTQQFALQPNVYVMLYVILLFVLILLMFLLLVV